MTEAEWLTCASVWDMVRLFPAATSARRLRLFAVACCRRLPGLAGGSLQALDAADLHAEGQADLTALRLAYMRAYGPVAAHEDNPGDGLAYDAAQAVAWAVVPEGVGRREAAAYAAYHAGRAAPGLAERRAQALLLADIMLSPPSASVTPAWLTPDVVRLAYAAYDERLLPSGELDRQRLLVLADALEDASCDNAEVLGHLRGPGVHVRGCWCVDQLTGRE